MDDILLAAQKQIFETQKKELQRRNKSAGKMLGVEKKPREILVKAIECRTDNTELQVSRISVG